MTCCANCFGDRGLRNEIIPFYSNSTGVCSYCQSTNVELVEPSQLGNVFELLVNIYVTDKNGKSLVEWLKKDWKLFDHIEMGSAKCEVLLREILNDEEIVRGRYSSQCIRDGARLESWEHLRTELMYENRFFPTTEIDQIRLQDLLSHLLLSQVEIEEFGIWHRARIQKSKDERFQIGDMSAPPKRLAFQGRANPAGIPYLYLASTPDTAIAEIRPHTGDYASVGHVTAESNLTVVDLRSPRKTVSPFLLSDEIEIAELREDIGFLVELGKELTRPILPHTAAIDYIPSQYICEFIKKCGYHGVLYESSVGEGVNLSLFDPNNATVFDVNYYRVVRVSVETDSNYQT